MKKELIKEIDECIDSIQEQVRKGISNINLKNLFIVLNEKKYKSNKFTHRGYSIIYSYDLCNDFKFIEMPSRMRCK